MRAPGVDRSTARAAVRPPDRSPTVDPKGPTLHTCEVGRNGGSGNGASWAHPAIALSNVRSASRTFSAARRVRALRGARHARVRQAARSGDEGCGAGGDDESVGSRFAARLEAAERERGLCRGLARERRADGARGAAVYLSPADGGGLEGGAVEPAGLGGPAASAVGRALLGRRGDDRRAGREGRGAWMAPPGVRRRRNVHRSAAARGLGRAEGSAGAARRGRSGCSTARPSTRREADSRSRCRTPSSEIMPTIARC